MKPESTAESLAQAASIAKSSMHACGADLLGVLLNRVSRSFRLSPVCTFDITC